MEAPAVPTPAAVPREGRVARWLVAAVAVAALVALFYPRGGERGPQPGGFLIDGAGKPVPVTAELGPATLVHFWATWCPPCRTELPELVRYARERRGGGLEVLFVAVGDEAEAARAFLGADDLRLLFDPAWEVAHRFRTDKLPETHLVLAGKVVRTFVGATAWNDAEVRGEVQKWIATPASPAP